MTERLAEAFWDTEIWPNGKLLQCSGTSCEHGSGIRQCRRQGRTTARLFLCWQHAERRVESDTSSNARPDTADDRTYWPEKSL